MERVRRVIRPQIRGEMLGALVEEDGMIFTLPVDLSESPGLILDRISGAVRELTAAIARERGDRSSRFTEDRARSVEADIARLRGLL